MKKNNTDINEVIASIMPLMNDEVIAGALGKRLKPVIKAYIKLFRYVYPAPQPSKGKLFYCQCVTPNMFIRAYKNKEYKEGVLVDWTWDMVADYKLKYNGENPIRDDKMLLFCMAYGSVLQTALNQAKENLNLKREVYIWKQQKK